MKTLLPSNPKLAALEHRAIDFLLRVAIMKKLHKKDKAFNVEKYRVDLALTCAASPFESRRYDAKSVSGAAQYAPEGCLRLNGLTDIELTSTHLDLSPFENIKRLDMHNNKLTDILDRL